MGGPTSPAKAANPPAMPRKREPNTTDRLTMFGPGRKWHSAKVSLNSSGGHPAVLLDNRAPGPDQDPAKAGQGHLGKGQEQLEQAGLVGRRRCGGIRRRNGNRRGFRGHEEILERPPNSAKDLGRDCSKTLVNPNR